jgi:hypothetical protein
VIKTEVEEKVGKEVAKIGFAKAMGRKWVQICGEKKDKVKRKSAMTAMRTLMTRKLWMDLRRENLLMVSR